MRNEIKIALVAIVGIVILFFGMNFLKGLHLFASDNSYYISFDDISGLSPSSPIYANGYKVGTVKNITYDYDKELPVSSLNNAFCAAVVLLLCSCAALSLSESEPQS